MRKHLSLLLAGALVASAAVAYNGGLFPLDQWFQGGIWVMPKSMGAVQVTTGTKITRLWALPRIDYDFPAIGPGGNGSAGGHLTSNTITATGVRLGDNCKVQSTGGDGGINPDLVLTCYPVAADTIVIRADAMLDDAGTINPSDAGHYIYLESSQ